MSRPRYIEVELWAEVCLLHQMQQAFYSLVKKKKYFITAVDEAKKSYIVRYESGREASVPFSDVYAVYRELHRTGKLPRSYFRKPENASRVVGHSWHKPGATIYAILPVLDTRVQVAEGGHLLVQPDSQ